MFPRGVAGAESPAWPRRPPRAPQPRRAPEPGAAPEDSAQPPLSRGGGDQAGRSSDSRTESRVCAVRRPPDPPDPPTVSAVSAPRAAAALPRLRPRLPFPDLRRSRAERTGRFQSWCPRQGGASRPSAHPSGLSAAPREQSLTCGGWAKLRGERRARVLGVSRAPLGPPGFPNKGPAARVTETREWGGRGRPWER